MLVLFAQGVLGGGIGQIILTVIIIAAAILIAIIALRAMGIQLPPWLIQILTVVAIAVVAILAIKFLLGV